MHVCGVPGNFRVGFLVGPLDLDFLSLFNYGIMAILPAKYGQCRFLSLFNYGIMTILPAKYGQCRFLSLFNYGVMADYKHKENLKYNCS